MVEILTIGEILVEIMRDKVDTDLNETDRFVGPFASGAPAIFIDAVARLGHSAAIIGGVGNDAFGTVCLKRLRDDGVDTYGIKVSKLPTGVAFVAYFLDGSRKFIFHVSDSAAADTGGLPAKAIKKVKIFHIMGCSLMVSKKLAEKIIRYAKIVKDSGGKVSFDPNIRVELMDKDYIKNTVKQAINLSDIVLPGIKELFLLTRNDDKDEAIKKLLEKVDVLVLKQGAKGCEIHSKNLKKPLKIFPFNVREVDPTGAGDAFDAGFICAYLEEQSLYECGVLANACGALNTTRLGPMEGIFKREIVEEYIKKNKTHNNI